MSKANTSTTSGLENYNFYYDENKKVANNILSGYDTDMAGLNRSRTASQQMADITKQKMLKYLPQVLKSQGVATVGASESALINANNQYVSQMGKIASDYNAQAGTLSKNKDDQLMSLYQTDQRQKKDAGDEQYRIASDYITNYSGDSSGLQNYINNLIQGKQGEMSDAQWQSLVGTEGTDGNYTGGIGQNKVDNLQKAETEKAQDEAYNYALTTIENWSDTPEALDEYVAGLKGKVSNEQYTILSNMKTDIQPQVKDEHAKTTAQAKTIGATVREDGSAGGYGIVVTYGGNSYTMKYESAPITDEIIVAAAENSDVTDGNVFKYGDVLYYKKDGNVYKVTGGTFGDDDFNKFKAVGGWKEKETEEEKAAREAKSKETSEKIIQAAMWLANYLK